MATRFEVGDRVWVRGRRNPDFSGVVRETDGGGPLQRTYYYVEPDPESFPGPPPTPRWVEEIYCRPWSERPEGV